jgi:hypothetical protein
MPSMPNGFEIWLENLSWKIRVQAGETASFHQQHIHGDAELLLA